MMWAKMFEYYNDNYVYHHLKIQSLGTGILCWTVSILWGIFDVCDILQFDLLPSSSDFIIILTEFLEVLNTRLVC
jgi:hypothetical protein